MHSWPGIVLQAAVLVQRPHMESLPCSACSMLPVTKSISSNKDQRMQSMEGLLGARQLPGGTRAAALQSKERTPQMMPCISHLQSSSCQSCLEVSS